MKKFLPVLAAAATVGLGLVPLEAQAQQVPDWLLKLKLPNSSAKSIMTPSAWGAAFGSAFLGAGAVDRTPYLPSADGVVGLGYGMGDPVLYVGLQLGTTVSDLSEFNNVSFSFKIHRYLAKGTSIAVGGESLFSNDRFADDVGDSFYFVVSHVLQAFGSNTPGIGRIHMSAGVGSGRFAKKSDRDFAEGKGRHGTVVFGSLSVEVLRDTNAILEWTGTNLLTGVSRTFQARTVPISFSLGLSDLTNYSGDGVRLIGGAAIGVSF
jgi:hypothetical protein